jgi:hypothetical protein
MNHVDLPEQMEDENAQAMQKARAAAAGFIATEVLERSLLYTDRQENVTSENVTAAGASDTTVSEGPLDQYSSSC